MKSICIQLVRFYQNVISPHVGTQCKFYPTCSAYSILAIKKYGTLVGISKTFRRILRCNPFSSGGIDFP